MLIFVDKLQKNKTVYRIKYSPHPINFLYDTKYIWHCYCRSDVHELHEFQMIYYFKNSINFKGLIISWNL
jgi:hypothetical protein